MNKLCIQHGADVKYIVKKQCNWDEFLSSTAWQATYSECVIVEIIIINFDNAIISYNTKHNASCEAALS